MKTIKLESIRNIRDLGETKTSDGNTIQRNRLIRSANLAKASEEDIAFLKEEFGLKAVVDLRTFQEVEEKPDQVYGLDYYHIPIIETFEDGITHENKKAKKFPRMEDTYAMIVTKKEYISGLSKALKQIMNCVENDQTVLWHCSEGKDRCGLVSALLLEMLGVDRKTIVKDYLETNKTNLDRAKAIYEKVREEAGEEIAITIYRAFIADEEYLKAAYDNMGEDFFEKKLKIDDAAIESFRKKMLKEK